MSEPRIVWITDHNSLGLIAQKSKPRNSDGIKFVEASVLDDLREKFDMLDKRAQLDVGYLRAENKRLRDALKKILNPWDGDPSGCTEEIARAALEKP